MNRIALAKVRLGLCALVLLAPQLSWSQENTEPEESTDATGEPPAPDAPTVEERLAQLEKLVEAQQVQLKLAHEQPGAGTSAEITELQAEVAALKEQVELAQMLEEQRMEQSLQAEDVHAQRLQAYGFFDVTFAKTWTQPRENILRLNSFNEGTFTMTGVNLYVHGQMTDTLSALIETRLTFLPHGDVEQRIVNIETGGTTTTTTPSFVRRDDTVQGPLSLQQFRPGGVLIERAHVDWTPHSLFNVRMGRFLTDYGIWNIDHGSPTIIAVLPPAMVSAQLVPNWLTGIEAWSDIHVADSTILHVEASVSNGRGPLDEVQDIDSNKAVTGRLKLAYENQRTEFSIGTFGYWGRYTDRTETVTVRLRDDLTAASNDPNSFAFTTDATESYREQMLAGDIRFLWQGLLAQGEAVVRKVTYDTPPLVDPTEALAFGLPLDSEVYAANHIGYAGYGLLAYELPLGDLLGGVLLTPYSSVERSVPADASAAVDQWQYRFGLNVKPSPYVTNKVEVMRIDPQNELLGKATNLYVQTAVAF